MTHTGGCIHDRLEILSDIVVYCPVRFVFLVLVLTFVQWTYCEHMAFSSACGALVLVW